LKSAAQDLTEQHAQQQQQNAEEDDVAQGQAKAKPARPAESFARRDHAGRPIM
jgi:hypothetical protein